MPLAKFPKWYFSIEKISAMLKLLANLSSGMKDIFMVTLSPAEALPGDVPDSDGDPRPFGLSPPVSGDLRCGPGDLDLELCLDLDLELLLLDLELLLDDFPPFFFRLGEDCLFWCAMLEK